jgi:hypothetical protein
MPDPESITPLLAERLDISTDRAETLLQSMLQELKSRAASEGVHLSELGTFEEEDGTLTFIPDPSLRRRVNHQFEGLSPEDLAAPSSARPEAEAPPSLREPSSGEAVTEPPSNKTDDESIPTINPIEEDEDTEPTASSDEPAPEPERPSVQPEGTTEHEDSTERSIPTLDPIDDEDEGDEPDMSPPDESHEPEEAEKEPPEETEEEESTGPIGTFPVVSSLLLFVILLGVGWFVLTETNLWSSSQPSYETSETETTQSADPEGPSQSADPGLTDDAPDDDPPERYAGVRPGDQPGETSGPAADAGTGTWTVVVASLSSRTEAEAMATDYRDHFPTVEVTPTTVSNGNQDRTLYRVTVGRYDSEVAAERTRRENGSMMPSDAWIHELP